MRQVVLKNQLTGDGIDIGKSAIVLLEKATPPIIGFFRLRYLDDPDCLEGDIDFLFLLEGTGLNEKYYLKSF